MQTDLGRRSATRRGATVLLLLALAGLPALTGCAQVKPIEREYLSSDIMQLDDDERGRSQEQHWLETLEASTGGYGGAAGGCACY